MSKQTDMKRQTKRPIPPWTDSPEFIESELGGGRQQIASELERLAKRSADREKRSRLNRLKRALLVSPGQDIARMGIKLDRLANATEKRRVEAEQRKTRSNNE